MSITVADVLLHGRDEHPSFDKYWTGDAPVLRHLTRYQQRTLAEISDIKRDAVRSEYEIELPLAWFEEGETIPAHIHVHGGDVIFKDGRDPEEIEQVGFKQRNERYRFRWGVYIQATTLKLLGKASDWNEVRRLILYYFPQGSTLTGTDSVFDLPGQALPTLTAQAARFIAKRLPAERIDAASLQLVLQDADDAHERYLDEVTGRRRAVFSKIVEVW